MEVRLEEYERVDDLITQDLKIIQSEKAFRFSTDAVLLADFVQIRKNDRVIDLGTGGGVIPLLLAARKKTKEIYGLEIQKKLVDMAQRSVLLNKLEEKIKILQGNLCQVKEQFTAGSFNVVVSNPPYYPLTGGVQVSPNQMVAIAKHEVTATLEDVIKAVSYLLNTNGRCAFVHRPFRLVDILLIMRQYHLEPKRIRLVYPYANSEPSLLLVEGVKKGKANVKIMPPLYIYGEDGQYTEELQEIYYGKEQD